MVKDVVGRACKPVMMFSGGKDSLVGLELVRMSGLLDKVKVVFPKSGYDFPEVEEMV